MRVDKLIDLCKIKGHMWAYSKRREIIRDDGLYSVAAEKYCARCGSIIKLNRNQLLVG